MIRSLIHEKLTFVPVLLATLLTIVSCKKSIPVGDIEGSVYFMGTIIAVADVTVQVAGITTHSSEEGYYRLEGIPTGSQTLTAEKTGFVPFSTEVSVQEGGITVLIPMLSPAFASLVHGVIKGNFSGDPKPGLMVVMLNPDGSDSDIRGVTDAEGNYQLQHVPFGDRTIEVRTPGDVFQANIAVTGPDYILDILLPEPMIFTDARDGKSYTAGMVGDQIWMTQNLAYLPIVCPPDWESDSQELYYIYGYVGTDVNQARLTSNYNKYGVLYNWPAAMKACPDGWHLPADDEWKTLEIFLGMEPEDANQVRWRVTGAVGRKLKSMSGWASEGNGANSSGFNAVPGGSRGTSGDFSGIGLYCNFWSSTLNTVSVPWNRFLSFENDGVSRYGLNPSLGFSVRCVKNK
ncbi:MAG: hypothetical protein IH592_08115 [Bacteroidales bacterium]|nr:hypothetical protein [Bacteroidales bacterium]